MIYDDDATRRLCPHHERPQRRFYEQLERKIFKDATRNATRNTTQSAG